MAPGKCRSASFQIQTAPSPRATLSRAHSQPLRQASVYMRKTERLGGLDGSHVGGGIRVADGPPFMVHQGLCKHAAELALARAGTLALDPAATALRFGGNGGDL